MYTKTRRKKYPENVEIIIGERDTEEDNEDNQQPSTTIHSMFNPPSKISYFLYLIEQKDKSLF